MAGSVQRSRVLRQPQSHHGCFTCKARRVKCDETRPTCQRCCKKKRQCEGYSDTQVDVVDVALDSLVRMASPTREILLAPCDPFQVETSRLVLLACLAVNQGIYHEKGVATSFWCIVLPQLATSCSTLLASWAALGAAIELRDRLDATTRLQCIHQYGRALHRVQNALTVDNATSTSVLAACMVLALTDSVLARNNQALLHLQGTLTLVRQRQRQNKAMGRSEPAPNHSTFRVVDQLDAAAAILDIGTSSFALGIQPRLPNLESSTACLAWDASSGMTELELRTLETLHSGFQFANHATDWKYVAPRLRPKTLELDQNRHVIHLLQRIRELKAFTSTQSSLYRTRALTLRAQCSACMVYISAILVPREVFYDDFEDSFVSILDDAAAVMGQRVMEQDENRKLNLSLDLGIIQPVLFTALKYRNSDGRRKALDLLQQSGKEGPFEGKREGLIARTVVRMEEASIQETNALSSVPLGTSIPERARVHGSAILDDLDLLNLPTEIEIVCFRCRDVSKMVAANTTDGYKDDVHWERKLQKMQWDNALLQQIFGRTCTL